MTALQLAMQSRATNWTEPLPTQILSALCKSLLLCWMFTNIIGSQQSEGVHNEVNQCSHFRLPKLQVVHRRPCCFRTKYIVSQRRATT